MPRFPTCPTFTKRALSAILAATLLVTVLTPSAQAQNRPPVADAGNDFSVIPGVDREGRLNGSGSFDFDDLPNTLTYRWRVVTSDYKWIRLTPTGSPSGRTAEFEVPPVNLVNQYGTYHIDFELTVTDRDGDSDRDIVRVTLSQQPEARIDVSAKLLNPNPTDLDGDGRIQTDEKYTIEAVIDRPGQRGNQDDEWDVQEGARLVLDASNSTGAGSSVLSYEWRKVTARPNYPAFTIEPGDLYGETVTIMLPDNLDNNRTAVAHYRVTITNNDGATDFATVQITVHDQPAAPTVEVELRDSSQPAQVAFQEGEDPRFVVAPGDSVVLTATADDKDGNQARSLTHQWRGNITPNPSNRAGTTSQATFTAPSTGPVGATHTVSVTVTDSTRRTATATITFVVVDNAAPSAVAPDDLISEDGKEGGTDGTGVMRVNGAGFDNDGDAITFQWIEVDDDGEPVEEATVELVNPDQAIVSFEVPELRGGQIDIILHLTVTDVWGVFDTDSVTITVLGRNEDPVANAGADQRAQTRSRVELDGTASFDPDPGDLFTFSWALTSIAVTPPARVTPVSAADLRALGDFWPTAGVYPNPLTASRTARPRFQAPNLIDLTSVRLTFTLTVTDREGRTDEDEVTITVVGRYFSGVVTGPNFCVNHSLGGPVTYPLDQDRDGIADICSLPYTRREAVARQSALAQLANLDPTKFAREVRTACREIAGDDFGDNQAALDADVCTTGQVSPPPPPANLVAYPNFFSGPVVTGPDFCVNHSLGGAVTYPYDIPPRDGIADICVLPYTRREAVARQTALAAFASGAQFRNALAAACRELANRVFPGDEAEDLDDDACAEPSTQPTQTGSNGTGQPLPGS
ncbi:MAG: hypothetical protein OXG30_00025 [bacterium]|nr:hypothetical protein [bacterium]